MCSDFEINIKIDLLLMGVKVNNSIQHTESIFKNTISEGIHIIINQRIFVTTFLNPKSPILLFADGLNYYLKQNDRVTLIDIIFTTDFALLETKKGIMFNTVGTLQIDRLRISAFKGCYHDLLDNECKFCEIGGIKRQYKNDIEDISEVITYSEINNPEIKHFLISGGTPPPNDWNHFEQICREIRRISKKSIYAMISPPPNMQVIKNIVDAGVNEIGINLELYNRDLAKKYMPGKAQSNLKIYFEALEYSVKLLGNTGNVRSVLIVGLETIDETLEGVRELAKRGIMPILSVFKPIKGTKLENWNQPSKGDLLYIWKEAQNICENYTQTLGPICVCCQHNTLTFPINNKYCKY